MASNIEEHKVYVESHKMYMIPYNVAINALAEQATALTSTDKFEKALEQIEEAFRNINLNVNSINNKEATDD